MAALNDRLTRRQRELRVIRKHRTGRNLKRQRTGFALGWTAPCISQRTAQQATQHAALQRYWLRHSISRRPADKPLRVVPDLPQEIRSRNGFGHRGRLAGPKLHAMEIVRRRAGLPHRGRKTALHGVRSG